jgi:hypothetical protein
MYAITHLKYQRADESFLHAFHCHPSSYGSFCHQELIDWLGFTLGQGTYITNLLTNYPGPLIDLTRQNFESGAKWVSTLPAGPLKYFTIFISDESLAILFKLTWAES